MTFKYVALDKNGKKVSGVLSVDTKESLKQQLKTDGNILVEAKEIKKSSNIGVIYKNKKKLKSEDLSNLCRQLAIIVSSGVSIISSLESIISQSNNKELKQELLRLYNGMQMGRSMAEIMLEPESKFPELMGGMVATGESTGKLDSVFKSMAEYYQKDSYIKKKIKSASIYPVFLCILAIAMVLGFMKFILPNIIEIITSSGAELPGITLFVMGIAEVVNKYFILIVIPIVLTVVGARWYINTPNGRVVKDTIKLKIPILNKAIKNIITSRFCQGLNLFIVSGFPLLQGLELMQKSINNALAEKAIQIAIKGIQQGEELVPNIAKANFFDKVFLQLLGVGEKTGAMGHITEQLKEFYESETELSINKAISMIEPVMMLVIGGLVGFLIISVALPMFTIYNSIE